jgi:hypothetical protein
MPWIRSRHQRSSTATKPANASPRLSETVIAMLILGVALAGCGGAGKTSSTSTAPARISKAAFIAEAKALCERDDLELKAAITKLGRRPSAAQSAAIVQSAFVPSVDAEIAGIRALGIPRGEAATLLHILALLRADLHKLTSDPVLEPASVFEDFERAADAYGLMGCVPAS